MADHPMTDDISLDNVYFSYWLRPGEVSKSIVPIKDTPHYRFAVAALTVANPVRDLPQGTGYGRYARWEAYCMGRPENPMHNEAKFAGHIQTWRQNYNGNPDYPIQVSSDPSDTIIVIDDGAHRAAFAAAMGSTTIKAIVGHFQPGTYIGIDAAALTVDRITAMENTIPRN